MITRLMASLILSTTVFSASFPAHAAPSIVDPTSGFLAPAPGLSYSWTRIGLNYVLVARGTKAYQANLSVAGATRRYVVLRPEPVAAGAPVMLMLHPRDTLPEAMSNLSGVADYVATQGFWAVMPQALGGSWQDVPSQGDQDLQFIAALIEVLVAQGADRSRIYAAGYSSGGFFAARLACAMSDKIAAIGMVSASMRYEAMSSCAPAVHRPKLFIGGTADSIAPYYETVGYGTLGMQNMAYQWGYKQGCTGVVSTTLPNRANDGTTVQLDEGTGCSGQVLKLYTVNGGGHAWPGGLPGLTGLTSLDINATGLIWDMARSFRLD